MKKILLSALILTTLGFGAKAQQTFEWANMRGSVGKDYVSGITSDNQGNTYVVGVYASATNDFDPDTAAAAVVSIPFNTSNDKSVYIQKLSAAGTHIWTKTLDSQNSTQQRVNDITTAPNGDLILCGSFKGGVDFDMGSGSANILSHNSGANADSYVLRLTQNGDFVWVKTFGLNNSSTDETRFLSVDTDSQGNIFVSGYFSGSTDADPNAGFKPFYTGYDKEGIVIKLSSTGSYQWAHEIGAPSSTSGNLQQIARNIMVDIDDNVWITADIEGTVIYSGYPLLTTIISTGAKGVGIMKVSNATGVPLISLEVLEAGQSCVAIDLAHDSNGNIYLTGWFKGTLTDDITQNTYDPNLTNESYFTASYHKNGGLRWVVSSGFQPNADYSRNYSLAYASNGTITVGGFIKGADFDADPSGSTHTVNNPYSSSSINRMSHIITYDTLGDFVSANAMGARFTYNQIDEIHIDANDNIYLGGYVNSSENKLNPISGVTTDIPTNGDADAFIVKLGLTSSVGVNSSTLEHKSLNFYPNPTSDQLTIENSEPIIESILVIDITGKTVKTIIPTNSTINVSELVKGIYFLQVKTEKGVSNSKFIKE